VLAAYDGNMDFNKNNIDFNKNITNDLLVFADVVMKLCLLHMMEIWMPCVKHHIV
jgi:hypothetical protein